ncbi:MAG: PP2C family serine/threonine-protein phosphatase [Gemmataceae bacterium]
MADFIHVGSRSAQGKRDNNEDSFLVDLPHRLYIVADGMGGQEHGERASGMAAEIISRVVQTGLATNEDPKLLLLRALNEANLAIIEEGRDQPEGRRMGTTAVLALQLNGTVYVTHLGDSRAYLVRGDSVRLLTVDHSVAQELVNHGVLSPEEARHSPLQHVLYRFLGCTQMEEDAEITPLVPEAGDRLVLGSDGLTNHIDDDDLREGAREFADPQVWCDQLVDMALARGSSDNVTCVVVAFEAEG